MDLFENVEIPDFGTSSVCVYCKNPYSLIGMCQSFHLICSECQHAFQNCPMCFGEFLPQNDLLMDAVLAPMNEEAENGANKANNKHYTKQIEHKKKTPLEKCKESFFLGVWDATISSLFSPRSKTITLKQSMSKIFSKIFKRMGKSVVGFISSNKTYKDKPILPVGISLLVLLVGTQYLFRRNAAIPKLVNPIKK